ncbi:IclR family transcriptional regulator [Gordonia sp. ABSL49_1]|uniref:IclR family transcriptional regulator n=1 Tax=Gordonia sp. ABSL49_1 TaxID=2920941 RepID=UPI0035AE5A42
MSEPVVVPGFVNRRGSVGLAMSDASDSEKSAGGAVQSVDRALQLLELIGRAGSAGVTELSVELGVHKSTVSRLLASLESRGFVEQLSGSRKYRIGFTVVRLAGSTTATLDLARHGQDICDALAMTTGETTNLAVLGGPQAINVVEAQGSSSVALQTWVGQSSPAHATSSGKVLLSALTAAELRKTLPRKLPQYTEHTITDFDALVTDLATITERGWAIAEEELEVGLVAVAAPVRDQAGRVVSALSVSGPRYRLDPDDAPDLADSIMRSAAELSARFGYHGSRTI